LRDTVLTQIKSGKSTEDKELSSVLDSLDTVQLTMESEELGIQPTAPIKSVGDLLWLFKAIDLKRELTRHCGHRKFTGEGNLYK
jgi:hypothetical protein